MKKVFSFNSELNKVTGVQKVMMDIHSAVRDMFVAKIVGTIPYEEIDINHNIRSEEYIRFKNPFIFYKSIVIVHERRYLLLFWLLKFVLFQQVKIIYVHHNIFNNHRLLSVMPQAVVSISDRCTENLISYFKVPLENIHKIYNCVRDVAPIPKKSDDRNVIRILYPARINSVKRQIEIYERLKGRIDKRIEIHFAGVGPKYDDLIEILRNEKQFIALGFRNDIVNLIYEYDYVMLYSKHEGLPISLIEAAMCSTPIICNDVGGNTEIAINNKNAFVVNDWDDLIHTINSLTNIEVEEYLRLCKGSRDLYEKKFTFDRFQKAYISLLSSLLKDKK